MTIPRAQARDEELIRRFLDARDQSAFRDLYRRHTPPVYGLICRLTGGRESDASDVMQDAWIRAARRLRDFRGDSQFRTWLTGIALNCYREWRRRSPAPDEALDPSGVRYSTHPSPGADSRRADIVQLLNELPIHYREVLVLHDVEGRTHDEIGAALGIEVGTSKSRLSRARSLFRAWWRQGAPTGR